MTVQSPPPTAVQRRRVQALTSPAGQPFWLVEEHRIPVVALEIAFRGGTAQDPVEQGGLTALMAGLLDEGAGDLDASAFQEALEARAIELSVSETRDTVVVRLRTLARHRDEAIRLLNLALSAPRFDEEAVARVQAQLVASVRRVQNQPGYVAGQAFMARAFPAHPYGRPERGTIESLGRLDRASVVAHHVRLLAREAAIVSVVGAIDVAAAGAAVDAALSGLPTRASTVPVADATLAAVDAPVILPLEIPQSTIRFGLPGLRRNDPDFIPATVLNHILGGGAFTARLWQEVREKRGLAYAVSSSLVALEHTGYLMGGTATKNGRAREALAVIEDEIQRLAENGPTEEEREKAIRFLTGSYALRFDTSTKIAGQLTQLQLEGLGPDYPDIRNDLFEAVTMADLRRAAARILAPGIALVTVAGQPEGF